MEDTKRLTVPDVIDRFRAYHQRYRVWGSLHIVLDDANIKDSDVLFCIRWAEDTGDAEGAALARILYDMSRIQRLRIRELA